LNVVGIAREGVCRTCAPRVERAKDIVEKLLYVCSRGEESRDGE